jgi:UDP-3-O-[3-hydroxymyristoyl] glucosamine N-acyltransferase
MRINSTSLKEIAAIIKAPFIGPENHQITGFNEIHRVEKGDVVFVDHPKYYDKALNCAATTIIINQEVPCPAGKALIIHKEPFTAFNELTLHFQPKQFSGVTISETAKVGKNVTIMPGCFIGNHVEIGDNCILYPNVVLYDYTVLKNNVTIHAGTVVGSDAFYYNTKKNRDVWYKKMESCGRVIIEDDVELGAGCTIDRGVTHDTRIGRGTKLDNQVHIGHDVVIGKNCLIAAQVGIAGATTLEDGVILWGQVGVNKTITIGANAIVMGQSGVHAHLEGGKVYWGTPPEEVIAKKRELVWIKRIPETITHEIDREHGQENRQPRKQRPMRREIQMVTRII